MFWRIDVGLISDLRHAARGLALRPGFTLTAVVMLALGIGANAAVFSGLWHTVIRPLPFAEAERIGFVWQAVENGGLMVSPAIDYVDAWKKGTRSVEQLELFSQQQFTVQRGEEPKVVQGAAIGHGLLPMLRLRPILGRNVVAEDERPGATRVALISEEYWRREFGGEKSVLGEQLRIDDENYQIVGVVPNALAAIEDEEQEIWTALQRRPGVPVFGRSMIRLREGATREHAVAELQQIANGIKVDHPLPGKWELKITLPQEDIESSTKQRMYALFAAVGMVLLIACANLAGLLLVRLAERRREIAIRVALGAGRLNIIRHLAVEAMLLAVLGGGIGVLVASWVVDLVRVVRPDDLVSLDAMVIDQPTLLFAAALALFTALLFSAAPMFSLLRGDLTKHIAAGTGATARVSEGNRIRTVLATGEIALSLVLLVGAMLLVRSVQQLQRAPLGFDKNDLLTARVFLPDARYATPEARQAFAGDFLRAIESLPQVRSATATTNVPPRLSMMFIGELEVAGKPGIGAKVGSALSGALVEPDFFQVMGVRLTGRTWEPNETKGVIINRKMADLLWPGENAIGQRVRNPGGDWEYVLGVVDNIAAGPVRADARPQIFNRLPYHWGEVMLAIRVQGDPRAVIPSVKQALRTLNPSLPLRDVATMDDLLADNIARERFSMTLLSTFAVLAVLLSLIGLYGVISNLVSRRSYEIGIRLALGATPAGVRRMVLREGLDLTVLGILLGGVGAYIAARLLQGLLYGVLPRDPVSFAVAAVVLAAGALLATWIPARRASSVDPLMMMRSE
jgi:putative ABC transport system permease protein